MQNFQVPTKAPANDLSMLKALETFKSIDKEIAEAVQNKLTKHLWYLNEANVALAFFDDEVDTATKIKNGGKFEKIRAS